MKIKTFKFTNQNVIMKYLLSLQRLRDKIKRKSPFFLTSLGVAFSFLVIFIFPQRQTITAKDNLSGYVPSQASFEITPSVTQGQELSVVEIIRLVTLSRGLSYAESERMIKIAKAESNLNPNVRGYAGNFYGLFQIWEPNFANYGCAGNIFSAYWNTQCAVTIYLRQGNFNDWEVVTDGLV